MLASENYVRECALRAIADDYEEFEGIFHDVTEYATGLGEPFPVQRRRGHWRNSSETVMRKHMICRLIVLLPGRWATCRLI